MREIEKWCPTLNAISFFGNKQSRKLDKNPMLSDNDWNICVTTYEMVLLEKSHLKKFEWNYLVVDESHRIKNEQTKLANAMRELNTQHRLLLTGTPLQNNLHELWSLLNFLLPEVFNSSEDFDNWFNFNLLTDDVRVQRLHSVLKPFLLRRLKSDVEKSLKPKNEFHIYVGLAKLQRKWYKNLLLKNIETINGNQKMRLLNVLMQLRKCTNHPYLFEGAEPGPPYTTDEHLVKNCGKMVLLDKLLQKLHKRGSRVLIFTQMTRMLTILEDYMFLRKYEYCRLDGQMQAEIREQQIAEFNKENSSKFVFLLSTRAGGLGINLATADSVIIYDSDWNPQMDLQAMDRAHRIGQKKEVSVFRLITENTVDERIVQCAEIKLRFDKIIQQARTAASLNSQQIKSIVNYGASHIISSTEAEMLDEDIDKILERGKAKTAERNAKLAEMGDSDVQTWHLEECAVTLPYTLYDFEGEDYRKKQKKDDDDNVTSLRMYRRERASKYKAITTILNGKSPPPSPPQPYKFYSRPTNLIQPDYRFYTKRFKELKEKQINAYYKQIDYKVPLNARQGKDAQRIQAEAQSKIDNAVVFTDHDQRQLCAEEEFGFAHWTKNDLLDYVNAVAKYGRCDFANIFRTMKSQNYEEVQRYHQVFWKRCYELKDIDNILRRIESGEGRKLDLIAMKTTLANKISEYRNPLGQLKIVYGTNNNCTDQYTELDDRLLLVLLNRLGIDQIGVYLNLHNEINSKDYGQSVYLKARTMSELKRRCEYLIFLIEDENKLLQIAAEKSDDDHDDEVPEKKSKLN